MAVLAAVKQQAALYLDRDKLSKQVIKRNSSLSVGDKIIALVKAMETLQQGGWLCMINIPMKNRTEMPLSVKSRNMMRT